MDVSQADAVSRETRVLAEYIAGSGDTELPGEVVRKAKQHTLDTLASVMSGSALLTG